MSDLTEVGSKKMSKMVKKESHSAEVDRLSELPDDILQHILCFLDTKYAVQTPVLSKGWRNLWTTVPALVLNSKSFSGLPAFKNFVRNLLHKRDCKSPPVHTIWFGYEGFHEKFMNTVISYAISHRVKHLTIYRWNNWPHKSFPSKLSECQDLETLQLDALEFTEPFRFTKLTSLHLKNCYFRGSGASFEVLSCCPNLKNLCLSRCRCDPELKVLKISGPQLLSLTIDNLKNNTGIACVTEVEISASEVTFFRCTGSDRVDFSVIKLPSLEQAYLDLSLCGSKPVFSQTLKKDYDNLVKLFEGISSVQSLALSSSTIKALAEVPGLEHLPTPFSRLKCLKLKQKHFNNGSLPSKVSRFLGCQEPCLIS